MRRAYIIEFLKFKNSLKDSYDDESVAFPDFWNEKTAILRLNHLLDFISSQLELRRALNFGRRVQSNSSRSTRAGYKKFVCPLCKGGHLSPKGNTRMYLSVCQIFIALSVEDRIAAVKRLKYCYICLNIDHSEKPCPRIQQLNCDCANANHKPHHKLLCKTNGFDRKNQKYIPNNGGKPPKKGQWPAILHDGIPCQNKGSQNSNCSNQNSNCSNGYFTCFLQNLPLLILSITAALDNVRNKEQEKIYKQFLNPDWLEKDIILQSCFLATARDNKNNEWQTIALADSGATITFVSQSLARKLNLQAVATWEGQINGINSSRKINANVYKIYIKVENKFVPILAVEINRIGFYGSLPQHAIVAYAAHYGVQPDVIFQRSGNIHMLIGMDNPALMLTKINSIDHVNVNPPPWSPHTFLYHTPASRLLTLAGAVGKKEQNMLNANIASNGFIISQNTNLKNILECINIALHLYKITDQPLPPSSIIDRTRSYFHFFLSNKIGTIQKNKILTSKVSVRLRQQ